MDVKITLIGRPPVGSAVLGSEHFRDVPVETDSSLAMAANNCPVRSSVVSREPRKGKEGDERQWLIARRDVEAVLLLREIAGLSRMTGSAGSEDTSRTQSQADGREGSAVGPTPPVSPRRRCVLPMRHWHVTFVAVIL